MNSKNFAVLVVCAISFAAFAQGKAPAPAKKAEMPMPQLPAEGKKWLESHMGNWKANDVVMTMGGKTMKGKMDLNCEKASSGWATLCKGKMDLGKEQPLQEVTFLMGWNIGDAVATMFEVSNMGEVHAHTGNWADEKSIALTHQGKTFDGRSEKDVVTFTWNSPKDLAIKAEGSSGTTVNWSMTATAKKEAEASLMK